MTVAWQRSVKAIAILFANRNLDGRNLVDDGVKFLLGLVVVVRHTADKRKKLLRRIFLQKNKICLSIPIFY